MYEPVLTLVLSDFCHQVIRLVGFWFCTGWKRLWLRKQMRCSSVKLVCSFLDQLPHPVGPAADLSIERSLVLKPTICSKPSRISDALATLVRLRRSLQLNGCQTLFQVQHQSK